MSQPIKRNCRCTQLQKEHLVAFMRHHPDVALNSFSSNMGQQRHQQLWVQLAQELGELGPTKTVDQWKIAWRDLKSRAKSANSSIYRAQRRTGNTQTVPTLTNMEDEILSVIGRTSSEGLPHVPESGLGVRASDVTNCENSPPVEENVQPGSSTTTGRDNIQPGPSTSSGRENVQPGPSTTTGRDNVQPGQTTSSRSASHSLGSVYEKSSANVVAVLTDISNHLKEKNLIEKERNLILKERNEILKGFLTQNPMLTIIEDD